MLSCISYPPSPPEPAPVPEPALPFCALALLLNVGEQSVPPPFPPVDPQELVPPLFMLLLNEVMHSP